jgi:hypothetical protein
MKERVTVKVFGSRRVEGLVEPIVREALTAAGFVVNPNPNLPPTLRLVASAEPGPVDRTDA